MTDRTLQFARESARLAGMESDAGFISAAENTASSLERDVVLHVDDLKRWHEQMMPSLVTSGGADPQRLEVSVREINEAMGQLPRFADAAAVVVAATKMMCTLTRHAPFPDGNLRLSRLIAHRTVLHAQMPPIIFRSSEHQAYIDANQSERAMRLYLGQKIREAVYDFKGEVLLCVSIPNAWSGVYRGESAPEKQVIVEWHDLHRAELEWTAAPL